MTELKEQRLKNRMTQREAAEKAGISLRSYISYENQEDKKGTPMYRLLLAEMSELGRLDEEHGILTMEEIREACGEIMKDYAVQYCYLFGSYAKGTATEDSDFDFYIIVKDGTENLMDLTAEAYKAIRDVRSRAVDIIIGTESRFESRKNRMGIENEVASKGVLLYGA